MGGLTNPREEPRFGCREDGLGKRRCLPHTVMAVEHGTGEELDGNSMSRAEKRLEREQEETGDGEEEEGTGGWEGGCSGAAAAL